MSQRIELWRFVDKELSDAQDGLGEILGLRLTEGDHHLADRIWKELEKLRRLIEAGARGRR